MEDTNDIQTPVDRRPFEPIVVRHGEPCGHCRQPLVEIARNEIYVFYKCACHKHKGADWDWRSALVDGVEYQLGSAGSFVHQCPACGEFTYRHDISTETCLLCNKARVEAVRVVN